MGLKCEWTSEDGRLKINFDAGVAKDVFGFMAKVVPPLMIEPCGLCGSKAGYSVRPAKTRDGRDCVYYEWRCGNPECNAKHSIGQNADEINLYVNRAEGWSIYAPEGQQSRGGGGSHPAQQQQQRQEPDPVQDDDIPF